MWRILTAHEVTKRPNPAVLNLMALLKPRSGYVNYDRTIHMNGARLLVFEYDVNPHSGNRQQPTSSEMRARHIRTSLHRSHYELFDMICQCEV